MNLTLSMKIVAMKKVVMKTKNPNPGLSFIQPQAEREITKGEFWQKATSFWVLL